MECTLKDRRQFMDNRFAYIKNSGWICLHCGLYCIRNGHDSKGRQRWICKGCKNSFVEGASRPYRIPQSLRRIISALVSEGVSHDVIARAFSVSNSAVRAIGQE